jgi:hypothetical protein
LIGLNPSNLTWHYGAQLKQAGCAQLNRSTETWKPEDN